jgi:hypothetical protein
VSVSAKWLNVRATTGRVHGTKFEGWGSPGPTLDLTQRARAHGATASESFLMPRFMSISGLIHAPSHAVLNDYTDRLSAAVTLDAFQFLVAHTDRVRTCQAQRQGEVIVTPITDKLASYSLLIVAKDPRKFGDLITASTCSRVSGGLTFPATSRPFTGVEPEIAVTNQERAPVGCGLMGRFLRVAGRQHMLARSRPCPLRRRWRLRLASS